MLRLPVAAPNAVGSSVLDFSSAFVPSHAFPLYRTFRRRGRVFSPITRGFPTRRGLPGGRFGPTGGFPTAYAVWPQRAPRVDDVGGFVHHRMRVRGSSVVPSLVVIFVFVSPRAAESHHRVVPSRLVRARARQHSTIRQGSEAASKVVGPRVQASKDFVLFVVCRGRGSFKVSRLGPRTVQQDKRYLGRASGSDGGNVLYSSPTLTLGVAATSTWGPGATLLSQRVCLRRLLSTYRPFKPYLLFNFLTLYVAAVVADMASSSSGHRGKVVLLFSYV